MIADMSKVPVGVTSAAGYGVTLASVIAAALDYVGGDHSQPTKTTLYLGVAAGLAFLSTQLGRFAQAKAQIHTAMYANPEPEAPSWLQEDLGPSTGTNVDWEDLPPSENDGPELPHDLVDEPEDDGSDQVPHHEQRDLHDGGRC